MPESVRMPLFICGFCVRLLCFFEGIGRIQANKVEFILEGN